MGNRTAERIEIGRDIRQVYRRILGGEDGLDHRLQLLVERYSSLGGKPEVSKRRVEGELAAVREDRAWKVHDVLVRARRAHNKRTEKARRHGQKIERAQERRAKDEKIQAENVVVAERTRRNYANMDPTNSGIGCPGIVLEHGLVLPEQKVLQLFEEHDVNWDLCWNTPFVVRDLDDPERPMTELQLEIIKFVGHVGAPLEAVARHVGLDRGTTKFLLFNLERQGFLWRNSGEWVVRDV